MVQVVPLSPRLLGAEGDELDGNRQRFDGSHPGELEQDRHTGGVVLGTRCGSHCVQVGSDDHVRARRVEAGRFRDDVRRRAAVDGDPPGVTSRDGHVDLRDVVAEAGQPLGHVGRCFGERG